MKGLARLVAYAVVIAGVVFVAVYQLTKEEPMPTIPDDRKPAPPPWKTSRRAVSDANEGFTVEKTSSGNKPLAGHGEGSPWPQFHGTNRDNRSDDQRLLTTWPEGGPNLLWSLKGLGDGFSSVAVVDGVAYTMGNKKDSEAVIALDVGTGEKIWSTPFARASKPSSGDGPRSTPCIHEGNVYVLGAEGELACLEAKSGQIRWQLNILRNYGAKNLVWGISESVLIDENKVICTPGGNLATMVALDKGTGKEIWKTRIEGAEAAYTSSVVADVGGVRQYVQFVSNATVSLRANDGMVLWRNSKSSCPANNCSSPLVVGNYVFSASNCQQGGALLKLTSENQSTMAELVYDTRDMKCHYGDMVIVNGLIFGSDDPGILVCLELETGAVKWQNRSVGKGSVTYADGKIILRGENGDVALVDAVADEYRELGRFTTPQSGERKLVSHPVVAHNRLFLRDQDWLYCYDLKNNSGSSSSSPAAAENE